MNMENDTQPHLSEKLHANRMVIARQIKLQRKSRHLSQAQLAKKLGLSSQQIQKYESGTDRVPAERLVLMAEILGCDLKDMISDSLRTDEYTQYQKSQLILHLVETSNPKVLNIVREVLSLAAMSH